MNKPTDWPFDTSRCNGAGAGERQRWQGYLSLKKTVGTPEIAVDVAEGLNMDPYTVMGVYRFTDKALIHKIQDGYNVNLELVGFRIGMRGSLPYSDSPFDKDTNELRVSAYTKPPLRDCLAGITPRNTTKGLTASIVSIHDNVALEEGVITVPSKVLVAGKNLLMGSELDEWCALLSKSGEIVARPTVLDNTGSTLDLDFGTLPEDGEYTLLVRARNNASTDFAPASARIAVTIRHAS